MKTALSIDPGIRGCGVAVWREGILAGASYVKSAAREGNGPGECVAMAKSILTGISAIGLPNDTLIVEWPQTYGGRAGKGDANDLFALAGIGSALAALLQDVRLAYFRPHDWKGGLEKPKSVSESYPIVSMCERRLHPEERANIYLPTNRKLQLDVWDAVGIGLKHFGRFEPVRVYARE